MHSDWTPGKIVDGKFRIDRVLGTGGMGMVLAATHLQLGQQVAIKVMRLAAGEDAVAAARFVREARSAGALRSEHVVKVKDFGTFEDCPYIVMELLDGADLEEMLEARGALPVVEAVRYVMQACIGLAEAHAHGIIHRDLKPANMFVTRLPDGESQVKLLDFGISKETWTEAGLTQTAVAMGSPYYMSPEQLRSAKNVNARADIWSLGAVLYELVAGRVPFNGASLFEVSLKVMQEEPTPLPHPELQAVVHRCLAKQPGQRYATVADLSEALAPLGPRGARVLAERARRTLDGSKPSIALPLPPAPPSPKPAREALARPKKQARPKPAPRPSRQRDILDASTLRYNPRRPWIVVGVVGGLLLAAVVLVVTWRPPSSRPKPTAVAPAPSVEAMPLPAKQPASDAAPPVVPASR